MIYENTSREMLSFSPVDTVLQVWARACQNPDVETSHCPQPHNFTLPHHERRVESKESKPIKGNINLE